MSVARQLIFQSIRSANGTPKPVKKILADSKALINNSSQLRPGFTEQSNLERFIEKATSERVTATVVEVSSLAAVPGEVAIYLEGASLPPAVAIQPRAVLTKLDWGDILVHHDLSANEPVAVSIADLAIAETGSVVFQSAPDAPTLMNFLPLHHVVVVRSDLIQRHLEDVYPFIGSGQSNQPRNLTIVTGTSGTADIEAKNIRGAHGPRFMHIILVE